MTDYKPKVGEPCEVEISEDGWVELTPALVTDKQVVCLANDGLIKAYGVNHNFRPIQTKQQKELDDLIDVLDQHVFGNLPELAIAIQDAGYTKSKPVKKVKLSELKPILQNYNFSNKHTYETLFYNWWLFDGKNLLGDFVESDDE